MSADAAAQDAAQRARREQLLREEPRAIPLDELPDARERPVVAHSFEHGKPQLTGVRHPDLEEPRHEQGEPVEDPLGLDVRRRFIGRRGFHDPLDEARGGRLEDPVEFAHARSPRRPAAFERLGQLDDAGCFRDEPEPWQAGGEPLEQPLTAAGSGDAIGPAAAGERHVEHRPTFEPILHHGEMASRGHRVTTEDRGEEPAEAATGRGRRVPRLAG